MLDGARIRPLLVVSKKGEESVAERRKYQAFVEDCPEDGPTPRAGVGLGSSWNAEEDQDGLDISAFGFMPAATCEHDDFQVSRSSRVVDELTLQEDLKVQQRHVKARRGKRTSAKKKAEEASQKTARISTLYKRKADKVLSMDTTTTNSSTFSGAKD